MGDPMVYAGNFVENISQMSYKELSELDKLIQYEKKRRLNLLGYQINTKKCINTFDTEEFMSVNPSYCNPYEYGSKQESFNTFRPDLNGSVMDGNFINNSRMAQGMNVNAYDFAERFPGQTKNVNVESPLIYGASTKTKGARRVMEELPDKFEQLYFDPQDSRHIVWPDYMPPRGGYGTRLDERHSRK